MSKTEILVEVPIQIASLRGFSVLSNSPVIWFSWWFHRSEIKLSFNKDCNSDDAKKKTKVSYQVPTLYITRWPFCLCLNTGFPPNLPLTMQYSISACELQLYRHLLRLGIWTKNSIDGVDLLPPTPSLNQISIRNLGETEGWYIGGNKSAPSIEFWTPFLLENEMVLVARSRSNLPEWCYPNRMRTWRITFCRVRFDLTRN